MQINEDMNLDVVPGNLNECLKLLVEGLDPYDLAALQRCVNAEFALAITHHGLGEWLRTNWSLAGDTFLTRWFKEIGIEHADDMSCTIIKALYFKLNGLTIDLNAEIAIAKANQRVEQQVGS